MHAFDVLGDPVRRRILELLADGELSSGAVTQRIQHEFGITQPGVSQHLRVLRESGFASVRPEGTRRLYAIETDPLRQAAQWIDRVTGFWEHRLDALELEIARGKRSRDQDQRGPPLTADRSSTTHILGASLVPAHQPSPPTPTGASDADRLRAADPSHRAPGRGAPDPGR